MKAAATAKLSVSRCSQGAYFTVGINWGIFSGLKELTIEMRDEHHLGARNAESRNFPHS